MIISKTPFRISFTGGGTDFKDFYEQTPGLIISTTIDKYMFITVNKRFDHTLRVSYSKTEIVERVEEIKHPIIRECLKWVGIKNGIEITSIADIPSGTGLGSSSSFTVGLLHALYAYLGQHKSANDLALAACQIEIDILGEPIGKQDQYAAAYGGLLRMEFNNDENVFVDPIICSKQTKDILNNNLLLFYTGMTRSASNILKHHQNKIKKNFSQLTEIRDFSNILKETLQNGKKFDSIGEILDKSWKIKKQLTNNITNDTVEDIYQTAIKGGAVGGKLLGAGGGGFLLLYCPSHKQKALRSKLKHLRELPFQLESQGSKIIYVD